MPGSGCLTWGASLRLVRKFGKVDISAWVVYKKSGSSTAGFAVFTRFFLQNFFNLSYDRWCNHVLNKNYQVENGLYEYFSKSRIDIIN